MIDELQYYDSKYMGEHVEYPIPSDCRFYLYEDRVEIENPDLVIPYNTITGIENMDEKKISAKRVVALGAVLLLLLLLVPCGKRITSILLSNLKTKIEIKRLF